MVRSQTGYRCPNGSCKAILDTFTSRPFQQYKEHLNASVLTPTIKLWIFGSHGGLQVPTFGSVSFILTVASKWGCNKTKEVVGSSKSQIDFDNTLKDENNKEQVEKPLTLNKVFFFKPYFFLICMNILPTMTKNSTTMLQQFAKTNVLLKNMDA
jgi:Na+/melibiose symporter-like transporter